MTDITLTRATVEYLLDIVNEELTSGGRSQFARLAQRELTAYLAQIKSPAALLFECRPHPTLPFTIWTLGAAGIDEEVPTGSAIGLGLHILALAAQQPHQHVDLSSLDPGPLEERSGQSFIGRLRGNVSRARALVSDRHPELAAALRHVELREDFTATYSPPPGSPEIIVK